MTVTVIRKTDMSCRYKKGQDKEQQNDGQEIIHTFGLGLDGGRRADGARRSRKR